MKTASEVHTDLFSPAKGREPRSAAYKQGCLDGLRYVMEGAQSTCPYFLGTVESDAWLFGRDEGMTVGRQHLSVDDAATAQQP